MAYLLTKGNNVNHTRLDLCSAHVSVSASITTRVRLLPIYQILIAVAYQLSVDLASVLLVKYAIQR